MIPAKARKLLALALDRGACDGEWRNAATMFVAALRKAGATADELFAPASAHQPQSCWQPPPSDWRSRSVTMPFGRHKGKPLREIPAEYLEWLLNLDTLRPELRAAVMHELLSR